MSTKTSLRQIKLTKRAKIAIGRTKVFQGDDETLVSDKKEFRRKKISRTSSNDGVNVTYENNKLYKRESNDETTRGGRKRVFFDRRNDAERRVNGSFGKFSERGKFDGFERVEKGKSLKRERKSRETDSFDRLITVKKRDNDRIDHRERLNNRDGNGSEFLGRPIKEKIFGKKNISDDRQDRRKKMKRDIRIDPNDVSNKRLDDAIATTGEAKKNEVDIDKEKRVEMSMNAQFRAIIPSPSILSFVEDNYLGRRRMIELSRAGYNTELSAPLDNIPSSKISDRERIEEPAPVTDLSPNALLYQANPTWVVNIRIKKAVKKQGLKVFRNKLTFFAAANASSSFPTPDLPEIAFAGRSNVGKSSMLNALTRQWGVARTSDKPGLTQTINFFTLGPKVSLVDLPGYGFAYAKEEVKEAWEDLVKEYVSTREGLKRVCLLIDTKWGMKPRDIELIDLMERSQTKYQIVLTKTDLVFPIDVARRAMQIEESLKAKKSAVQPVMMVSSKSGRASGL